MALDVRAMQRFRSMMAGDEMALVIEMVVDLGVN